VFVNDSIEPCEALETQCRAWSVLLSVRGGSLICDRLGGVDRPYPPIIDILQAHG
jgi:hypothetical protein